MERIILRSESKENIKLLADVARKMGVEVEYAFDDEMEIIAEPKALAEWDRLTTEQQQGIVDALEDLDKNGGIPHEEVMREMRKRYE